MPRSISPERRSVPPGKADDRVLRPHSLLPSAPPDAESTRDVTQEDFLFHLYRGSEFLQENRVLEAKEELEYALTMQPSDPKGQDLLAAVYFRLGLYPRSIQIHEVLAAQFPRDVSVKINLALGYLKTGQPELARSVLQEAVSLNPDHKRAWGYLGLALQKLGDTEQAQSAFHRGGHPMMVRRLSDARRRSLSPENAEPAPMDAGVREVFTELDAGELRFSLAAPELRRPGEGTWHTLEIGEPGPPADPVTRTQPFVSARELTTAHDGRGLVSRTDAATASPEVFANTRLVPPPPAPPGAPRFDEPQEPTDAGRSASSDAREPSGTPSLLALPAHRSIGLHASGVLLVQTEEEPTRGFAGRADAMRAVTGTVTTRILYRRTRDADSAEMLGGVASPLVRFTGSAQLVIGPRPRHELALLGVEDHLAFVREEYLLGFELSLAYENGRIALEPSAEGGWPDGGRPPPEGSAVIQLRGTGAFVLELTAPLASIACTPERPLMVRREWIVGWLGRLMPRALSPAETPNGQRGLVGFSGDGAVLVCATV
jgi:hypothetical protein